VTHHLSARVQVAPERDYTDPLTGRVEKGLAFIDGTPVALTEFQSMLARGFNPDNPDDTGWLQ
jgi:hypothetical protein